MFDSGYDLARLAFLLTDLPVEILGRIRSDRVLRQPVAPRGPDARGRSPKHGKEFRLADRDTWSDPAVITTTGTTRYGTAVAIAWDRLHPRLTHRAAWLDHPGELPVLEGTLICLTVDRLPSDHDPKPLWLWSSRILGDTGNDGDASPSHVDRLWHAYLRRFDSLRPASGAHSGTSDRNPASRQSTGSRRTRARTSTRIQEPNHRHPPRRRQNHPAGPDPQRPTRLKIKLRGDRRFNGHEYGLFTVADSMATGSSIMPQKKNPVVAELVRARAGRAYGALVQVLVIAKSVGLGYSCDLQEDKPVRWDAIGTVAARSFTTNRERTSA
ncbi:transposase [Dactylosporangium sp. NPDC005555]|uniref:transposase n=1 Tax=Dactylosporangium sp. NPDC005555 TaxID=3154889 RepID=UPI00339F93EB